MKRLNYFVCTAFAIAAAVACDPTEEGPKDFPIVGEFSLYGEIAPATQVGVFVTSDGIEQSNLLYTAAEGEGVVELKAGDVKAGFKQGDHMIYAYAPYAEGTQDAAAVQVPDYTKQTTVAFDPFVGDETLEGLMLSYNTTAKSVAYASVDVKEYSSAAITLPFETLNPLTVVTVGEPGLSGENANDQIGKKIKKVVITCDKDIAYSGQTLDLTTGKLTEGTPSKSIELAVDITVTKMAFVMAKGCSFATILSEEELAEATFKIEMFVEGGKSYAAEGLKPNYGGIYGLELNEVE